MNAMHRLGFHRLHLGVQSLQEPVRHAIKRRRPVAELLQRIAEALARGWVVSVDLVCGLPGQTLPEWVSDIETLIRAGVNGLSLYELLIYPQNQKWAASLGLTERGHVDNFFMFQAGASVLEQAGFHKNLFNHWADSKDKNIYFTFPTRGEDCLAVGTIADGVMGDYHFRHPRYANYMRHSGNGQPGLQGGLRRTPQETALLPFTTALLAGYIPPSQVPFFKSRPLGAASLCDAWQQHQLIAADITRGGFQLTATGSWFAGNMVRELMDCS